MVLAKSPIMISGFNMMAVAAFMFPTFSMLPARAILAIMVIVGLIGLPVGMYAKYRAAFATSFSCIYIPYFLFGVEFLFFGGGAVLAVVLAGRPDLKVFSLAMWGLSILMPLLAGIYRETRSLRLYEKDGGEFWQKTLGKYIDYRQFSISPHFSAEVTFSRSQFSNAILIIAVGSTNIPLLFELYGGGRNNAIFLAIPLAVGTFAYLNFCKLGPWIVKLYLLRKLERSFGRRFINADYEQIQALRRTFFLSRWLMKDYIGHQIADLEPSVEPKRKVRAVRRMHLCKRR